MTVKIDREAFDAQVAEEVIPLARKCWQESTEFKGETCAYYGERDFAIEPDTDAYLGLADQGRLAFVSLRDEGVLKGYVIGFMYASLHHKKIPCGIGDSIYIEPDYRGKHTLTMVKRFENELKRLGAQIIGWPVHYQGPVYKVLEAMGYTGDDVVMERRLKDSQEN